MAKKNKKVKTKKVAAGKKNLKKAKAKKPQKKAIKIVVRPAPKPTAPKIIIHAEEVPKHKPMTQAELEEVEQKLQDSGYRLSIMTNISDAERKAAFEAALEKAVRANKPYETTWEGNIVTLWVKKEK